MGAMVGGLNGRDAAEAVARRRRMQWLFFCMDPAREGNASSAVVTFRIQLDNIRTPIRRMAAPAGLFYSVDGLCAFLPCPSSSSSSPPSTTSGSISSPPSLFMTLLTTSTAPSPL